MSYLFLDVGLEQQQEAVWNVPWGFSVCSGGSGDWQGTAVHGIPIISHEHTVPNLRSVSVSSLSEESSQGILSAVPILCDSADSEAFWRTDKICSLFFPEVCVLIPHFLWLLVESVCACWWSFQHANPFRELSRKSVGVTRNWRELDVNTVTHTLGPSTYLTFFASIQYQSDAYTHLHILYYCYVHILQ